MTDRSRAPSRTYSLIKPSDIFGLINDVFRRRKGIQEHARNWHPIEVVGMSEQRRNSYKKGKPRWSSLFN